MKVFYSCRCFRIYPDMVADFLGKVTLADLESLRKKIKACKTKKQKQAIEKRIEALNKKSGIVRLNAKIGDDKGNSAHERRLQASVCFSDLHQLFSDKYPRLYETYDTESSDIALPWSFESGPRFAKPAVLPAPQSGAQTSAAGGKQPDVGAIAAE